MNSTKTVFSAVALSVFAAGLTANAAFRSSSTGTGVATQAPPALCVGVPATNEPCVTTADSAEYGTVLNIRNSAAGGTLTRADIEGLGITIPSNVDLGDADTISYLSERLTANIAVGNTPSPQSISDISSIITGAASSMVNRWVIGQAAAGTNGYSISTSTMNGAGVDASILLNVDVTVSTLDADITSSGLAAVPTVVQIEDWVTRAAGFHSSQTYQDVLTATNSTNGWSIANFKAASGKGYSSARADRLLYVDALSGTYTSSCRAEISSSTAICTDLTKPQFSSAKSGSALLAAKKLKATAGTLTLADLTELGLNTSTLGSSPSNIEMQYLMSTLGTGTAVSKADWQTSLNGFSAATANAWYLWKIAASSDTSGTYAPSNATTSVFNAANASAAVTALGVTNSQIQGAIRSAGFTATPSATALNDFLTEARGFASGTSYASVSGALANGWTMANYLTASNSGGWTSSGTDKTAFDACLSDSSATTGGSGSCQVTQASWTALAAAVAAAADTSTDLTGDQATSILATNATAAHGFFNPADPVMMDYLNQCISGASNAVSAVSNCVSTGIGGSGGVSEATLKQNVTSYKLGQIAATNSGTYASSTVTQSDMVNIGLASHESGIIGANYCGTAGTSSCLDVIRSGLATSGLTAASTAASVQNWINTAMRAHMQNTVAANQSVPANPTSSGDACAPSNTAQQVTLPIPHGCQHSSWTCTFQGSKSPSGLTLDVPDGNVKLAITSGGPVNGVNYTIRKSLNYVGGTYYKDFTYSLNIPASSNASASVQLTNHTGGGNMVTKGWNHCLNKGNGWELAEYGEVPAAQRSWSGTKVYAVNGSTARRVPSCGSGWGQNNLITSWSTWRNHGHRPYRAKYRNASNNIVTSACGSSSSTGNLRWWCVNASTYSCNP